MTNQEIAETIISYRKVKTFAIAILIAISLIAAYSLIRTGLTSELKHVRYTILLGWASISTSSMAILLSHSKKAKDLTELLDYKSENLTTTNINDDYVLIKGPATETEKFKVVEQKSVVLSKKEIIHLESLLKNAN
jgi:hypothetical protein